MNQGTVTSSGAEVIKPVRLAKLPPTPFISILLANYNYAEYIPSCIDSVLRQSYQRWELIICDDGSTDESVSVIKKYLAIDQRIKLLLKNNGGHTSALNMLFPVCRGDIVALIDTDDLFVPEKLKCLVAAYTHNPLVGTVTHRIIRVNQNRRRQGVYPLTALTDGWLGPELLLTGGIIPCAPPTSAITFRREVGSSIFPISTLSPLHMCPDQVIMRIAPLITPILRLPDTLAEHRVHHANAYSSSRISLQSVCRQLEISKALWKEQHRFLKRLNPDIAAQLESHDQSPSAAVLEYIAAKLRSDSSAPSYLSKYLESCQRTGQSKWGLFWRLSIYLPNSCFRWSVGLITGQGILKQFVAGFKKLV